MKNELHFRLLISSVISPRGEAAPGICRRGRVGVGGVGGSRTVGVTGKRIIQVAVKGPCSRGQQSVVPTSKDGWSWESC